MAKAKAKIQVKSGALGRPKHHVIIGSGITGTQAAATLRERDPRSRITIVTMSNLLFYNRYDLPDVFRGQEDWRNFLVHQPSYYEKNDIKIRRSSRVVNVDAKNRVITLGHKESIRYDTLLVSSGGRGYLPEDIADYRPLMHDFATFEAAIEVKNILPKNGQVVMLGGDMLGLDLARNLIKCGFKVTLVTGEHTFWPHTVEGKEGKTFLRALESMGVEILDGDKAGGIASIEAGSKKSEPTRTVMFKDESKLSGDVVMPFFGLIPAVEFMLGSGADIERGLLVSPELRTTDENIFAAGDVCQIWDKTEKSYRFFYGWKNVRVMGEVAARNMTGDNVAFVTTQDEKLRLDKKGQIQSPFWEYD